ncbi:hypothetical protein AHAS_Ahas05G0125700 [Arachis hypogaea]
MDDGVNGHLSGENCSKDKAQVDGKESASEPAKRVGTWVHRRAKDATRLMEDAGTVLETDSGNTTVEDMLTKEEQMKKNEATWALAVESDAVLHDEKEDIMEILQAQNEKLASIEEDSKT